MCLGRKSNNAKKVRARRTTTGTVFRQGCIRICNDHGWCGYRATATTTTTTKKIVTGLAGCWQKVVTQDV